MEKPKLVKAPEVKKEEKPKWIQKSSCSHNLMENVIAVEALGYEVFQIITIKMGDDDILIVAKLK